MSKPRLLIYVDSSYPEAINDAVFADFEVTRVATVEDGYYHSFNDTRANFEAVFILANSLTPSLEKLMRCIHRHRLSTNLYCISEVNKMNSGLEGWRFNDDSTASYTHFLRQHLPRLKRRQPLRDESRRREHKVLQSLHHEYEVLLEGAGEGILGLDEQGNITFANKTASELMGVSRERLLGQPFTQYSIDSPLQLGSGASSFSSKQDGLRRVGRGLIHRGDGKQIYVEFTHSFVGNKNGNTVSIMVFEDIGERIKFESKLMQLAHRDKLTGLYNRYYFENTVRKELAGKRTEQNSLAVALIDLDGFKEVNDNIGHVLGDRLLIMIGKRIQECVRRSDLVARLGGDEFCVLFKNSQPSELESLLDKIRFQVSLPCEINEKVVKVTTSIGYSKATPEDSFESLLARADEAMYDIKRNGKNSVGRHYRESASLVEG